MQTTMLIDIENYRVLLLGACRPREKYFFSSALPIAFSRTPGSDIGSDMSEPDVGTSQQSETKNPLKNADNNVD